MLFEQALQNSPNDLALSDTKQTRSWQQLHDQVLALRDYLLNGLLNGKLPNDKKLERNQHIALLIGNRVEFFEAMIAGIVSGLWVTPINTHLSQEERLYILKDCDASLVFYDNEHQDIIESNLPCQAVNIETLSQKCLSANNFQNNTQNLSLPKDAFAGGTMLYTSGTTGKPKGVRRNKPDLLSDALDKMSQGALGFGLAGKGPHLITGPLYHAAPMLFALYDMINGAPVIIMPKWNTKHFIELVAEYKIHTSHLVPTMFVRLLHLHEQQPIPANNLQSLKLVLHGAAPIAPSTKHKMIDWWGPILIEYWGASEAGTSTLVNSEDWLKHPGTVGKALKHLEIFVGDKAGNAIKSKNGDPTTGLLFCKHQSLKQVFEYHKDPAKTKKAHPKEHIFCIGDIGHVDSEGYVYLSDRESNMIISGGVNIYPAEIEQALIEHPDIVDLAVFGIQDYEWGETVKALIELKKGISASDKLIEDIKNFASDKIAKYKIPRVIEFIETLPRNAAGKVRVQDLKK
jgi:acyl-CoA synthetase (AMP-forming)/AMP-acid ligase II